MTVSIGLNVGLAMAGDDPAIRALLARNSIPGRIRLSYRRDPDYFLGCGPTGPFHQVLVARDADGELAGLATRAVRTVFINGQPRALGYLGQLRVDGAHRGRQLVSRGFRFLRQLHGDGRTAAYVTTIVEGNGAATGVLVEHPRRGMPHYRFVDRLHTLALIAPTRRRPVAASARAATAEELPEILSFLRAEGSRRQFFPILSVDDFGSEITRGLTVSDLVVMREGGRLAAVCALWDQSGYKQTVVEGYDGAWAVLRPLYNGASRLLRRPPLPAPGSVLHVACASFLAVRNDHPATLTALLEAALQSARERGIDYVAAAFSSRDPLLDTARRLPHIPYRSDIYTVAWDDGADFHDQLDGRPCYLDPATL
jgi:hypothetical protein